MVNTEKEAEQIMQALQRELLAGKVQRLWDIRAVAQTPPWSGVTAAPSLALSLGLIQNLRPILDQ